MSGKLLAGDSDNDVPASAEVEFALVLSRMIESVKNDPEDLRRAIYELARYKLQEQFSQADAKYVRSSQDALEAAIRGVEDFSKRHVDVPAAVPVLPPSHVSKIPVPLQQSLSRDPVSDGTKRLHGPPIDIATVKPERRPRKFMYRMLALIAVIFIGAGLIQQRDRLLSLAGLLRPDARAKRAESTVGPAIAPVVVPAPLKPSRLLPTDYGVYAISHDTLVSLEQNPGRPPDMRVAISAAITSAPQAVLSDGHPKFIVFRRDIGINASDRADVRIVARIARDFSATVAGGNTEDTWVMRNIAVPFRASPIPDNPDMFELHSENPVELSPGRYALALKTTSYDFSVAGTPVDPKHCLERVVSLSGTFYTECKKP